MSARLTPQREAEIRQHLASTDNHSLGNLAARDLLAELDAVRAELENTNDHLNWLERNVLGDLHRQVQHQRDGKKRWRDRAEQAEARVAEMTAASFEQAAARTHSPSEQIAFRLDAWLITHPGTCAADQDYPGWAEHIAELQASNHTAYSAAKGGSR